MKIKEKYVRWLGIPLMGLLLPVTLKLGSGKEPYLYHALMSTVHTFTFWQGNVLIMFYLRRKFPSYQETETRIIYTLLSCSFYTLLVGIALDFALYKLGFVEQSCTMGSTSDFVKEMARNFGLTFMVGIVYETTYFFRKWRETVLEAEKLKSQHIRSQFEVLKNQVSPHFLFNSLNTLITIIPENANLAVEFTEKLSQVYRYILQNKDKELVKLSTELDFIKSYIFLLKIRFGNNLKVNYDIQDTYLDSHVAPLTLQMLVENAIKHNIISQSKPLTIDIYIDQGRSIVVRNNLQKKNATIQSTRIGLENIVKRYKYLSNQAVDIISTATNFIVALPLIQVQEPA